MTRITTPRNRVFEYHPAIARYKIGETTICKRQGVIVGNIVGRLGAIMNDIPGSIGIADATRYVVHYASQALDDIANNDTLTFAYSRFPYFISGDCGVVFNYTITSFGYTRHLLDSAVLVNPEVTNREAETIQLFYYVAIEE